MNILRSTFLTFEIGVSSKKKQEFITLSFIFSLSLGLGLGTVVSALIVFGLDLGQLAAQIYIWVDGICGSGHIGTMWQGWTMQEWTNRHGMARVDNAGEIIQ